MDYKIPKRLWDLPTLLSLELGDINFPQSVTDFLSAFVSLQSLTLHIMDLKLPGFLLSTWILSR